MVTDDAGRVREIQVKQPGAEVELGLGRFQDARRGLSRAARALAERERSDEYIGTLVNAWLAPRRRSASACAPGESYVDVGTLNGYRARHSAPEPGARRAALRSTVRPAPAEAIA